jgi:hypothetical protein
MPDAQPTTLSTTLAGIHIVGLNTDKTRRTMGSLTVYQVYFELSNAPPLAWRDIFGREWKNANPKQEAGIDGRFLVMHCPLQDIATTHLPALKKAVAATNASYVQYSSEEATKEAHKADEWKQERNTVEEMARKLKFEE